MVDPWGSSLLQQPQAALTNSAEVGSNEPDTKHSGRLKPGLHSGRFIPVAFCIPVNISDFINLIMGVQVLQQRSHTYSQFNS